MNNIYQLNQVIEFIEKNIFTEINIGDLAKMTGLSVYEFRRIFSFVAGVPINEYIRKRRMSLCAEKLLNEEENLSDLSIMCGYDSPSSFSRAFKDFHGFAPSETKNESQNLKTFTKVSFTANVVGGLDIKYTLRNFDDFYVCGFFGKSDVSDTECCENVWQDFNKSDISGKLVKASKQIFAVYKNDGDRVDCFIGKKSDKTIDGLDCIKVNSGLYAEFTLNCIDDVFVNKFYKEILNEWLESTGYIRTDNLSNIEIFPSDMSKEGFNWKILLGVKRK